MSVAALACRKPVRALLLAGLCSLAAFTVACSQYPDPQIDRIETRESGWSSRDIVLNRDGKGRYRIHDYPRERSGSFSVSSQQFERFRKRLEPFRRAAVPFSDKSAREFIEMECPGGVPFVTDHGAIYIRWIGTRTDEHYLADLGCDRERYADRNRNLSGILDSLPAPHDLWSKR